MSEKIPIFRRENVREVIGDIECFPNFFRRFALDHVCNSFASSI
jgi:hypothetical protein